MRLSYIAAGGVLILHFSGCLDSFEGASPVSATSLGSDPTAGAASAWHSTTCPAGQYDMLGWMTPTNGMSPNHQEGLNNGAKSWLYSNVQFTGANQGTMYWVKSPSGYPWDLQLFDANGIYYYLTGYSFTDPTNLGFYGTNGPSSTAVKMFPRCASGGFPGTATLIGDFTLSATKGGGNCSLATNPGGPGHGNTSIRTEVWGPYNYSLGGNLPANNPTLVLAYLYGCDSNHNNCQYKENEFYQQGYGFVYWQYFLWQNGTWVLNNQTSLNVQTPGATPAYVFPCVPL